MKRVILESPFAGNTIQNIIYSRLCMADSLARGEAPFASHMLYTQPMVLDDTDPAQRAQGIAAGLAWGDVADRTVVYQDLGISEGMTQGINAAIKDGRAVYFRTLVGEKFSSHADLISYVRNYDIPKTAIALLEKARRHIINHDNPGDAITALDTVLLMMKGPQHD